MASIGFRPWAVLSLIVVLIAHAGCADRPANRPKSAAPVDSAIGPASAQKNGSAAASPPPTVVGSRTKPENILNSFGDPSAMLVISGQQNGYMEPCGCSEDQEGGLIRRSDFVDRMHKRKWPTVQIDLGSLIKDPGSARGGFEQAKIKFDYAVKALKLLNYSALALSADDLKIGVAEALGLFDNGLGDTTRIVVANVEPEEVFKKTFRTSMIVPAGPIKLGFTAVIDPAALQKLNDPDKDALLPRIKEPDAVLPGVLTELESKSDYQILMVQGSPDQARSLAKANPGFDIVVATSDSDDVLNPEPEMLNDGKTMVISVGKKGKCVGVVSFYATGSPRLRYRLVTLNKYFDQSDTPIKALIEDEYRGTLKAAGVVENFLRRDYVNGTPGATFVGAQSCKECHPNTYQFWASTKHARALESLKNDHKPNTVFDAECVTCHTTGFEYNSGCAPRPRPRTWPGINARIAMDLVRNTLLSLIMPRSARP